MISFLFAIVVMVIVIVYFPANTYATPANVTGYSQYTGSKLSLQYPTEWTIENVSTPESESVDLSNEMILVTIFFAPTDIEAESRSLEQIFPQMVKSFTSQIREGTLTELEEPVYNRYIVDGHRAGSDVYTATYGNIPAKNILVGTIVGNNDFLLTYSAPEAIFDQNLPIVENIIKSIKFSEETSLDATAVATPTNITEYSQYTGDGFSLQYPADWTIQQNDMAGYPGGPVGEGIIMFNNISQFPEIMVGFLAPIEVNNMTQADMDSQLEQMFPPFLQGVISEITRGTLTELEKPIYDKYVVDGHKAGSAVFTATYVEIPFKSIVIGTIVGQNAFGLAYSTPEAVFDQGLPIAENIINSIKLGNKSDRPSTATNNITELGEQTKGELPIMQGTNATNATGAPSGAAGGQTTVVMPLGSSAATSGEGYVPPEITVSPAAAVVWDNQDNALHTATSGESPTPDGKFDTGLIGANQESRPITMPAEPGEYTYFCTLHPFLVGTVIVQ